jgi:hypothetical protein
VANIAIGLPRRNAPLHARRRYGLLLPILILEMLAMSPTCKLGLVVPAAFLATLALPSTAASQYRLPTITSVAKADSLHEAAEIMARTTHRWRDAAQLHRQAAALRPAGDPLGFRCLTVAGQLSFASNDLSSAQRDMVAAAEQALARGDIEKAAHAYADAAWVAKERKNPGKAWTLGSQAEVLASSPLLSATQRASILQRFVHPDRDLAAQATR